MYEIEVTITTSTRTEFKVTADWPLIWLQAPGSMKILRKLFPGEIVPPLKESVKRSELPISRVFRSNLHIGDRLLVLCLLKGESFG